MCIRDRVKDVDKTEKAFHTAFSPNRVNPKREFFNIDPEQAIAVLELMAIEDVTPSVQKEAENVDLEANISSEKFKQKQRPRMNFIEMGMELGENLIFERDQIECTIYSDTKVKYDEEIYSLTGLTKKLLGDGNKRRRRGTKWWFYKGRNLVDIYNETYTGE